MIALIFNLLLVAILAWVGTSLWRGYRAAEGETRWERAINAAKGSATILWAQLVIVATALINTLAAIGGVVDPGMAESIRDAFSPEVFAVVLVAIMGVSALARLRSLSKDD